MDTVYLCKCFTGTASCSSVHSSNFLPVNIWSTEMNFGNIATIHENFYISVRIFFLSFSKQSNYQQALFTRFHCNRGINEITCSVGLTA